MRPFVAPTAVETPGAAVAITAAAVATTAPAAAAAPAAASPLAHYLLMWHPLQERTEQALMLAGYLVGCRRPRSAFPAL